MPKVYYRLTDQELRKILELQAKKQKSLKISSRQTVILKQFASSGVYASCCCERFGNPVVPGAPDDEKEDRRLLMSCIVEMLAKNPGLLKEPANKLAQEVVAVFEVDPSRLDKIDFEAAVKEAAKSHPTVPAEGLGGGKLSMKFEARFSGTIGAPSPGLFGSTLQPNAPFGTSGGIFGSSTAPTPATPFGQSTTAPGAFGAPSTSTFGGGGGGFGASTSTAFGAPATGGLFGSTAQAPAFGTASTFGASTSAATPFCITPAPSTNILGTPSPAGLFGSAPTPAAAPVPGGLFGSSAHTQPPPSTPTDDSMLDRKLPAAPRLNRQSPSSASHEQSSIDSADQSRLQSDSSDDVARGNFSTSGSAPRAGLQQPLNSLQGFNEMWTAAEKDLGKTTVEIEKAKGGFVKSTMGLSEQRQAPYGRLMPDATNRVFRDYLKLTKEDVYVDWGHGIGNMVLQAAYTNGCESRGIEVCDNRHLLSKTFQFFFKAHQTTTPGEVVLEHGRLEDPANRLFLTDYSYHQKGAKTRSGSMKIMFNNFGGSFGDKALKGKQKYCLDDFAAGLFAQTKPGSILVTLNPLNLPPSFSEAKNHRELHNMSDNEHASFYKLESATLGKQNECASWSLGHSTDKEMKLYCYTRLPQESAAATFLCCNPDCRKAKKAIPIPATKVVSENVRQGKEDRIVINTCDCAYQPKTLRPRKLKG